jgi:hypothetical protein
LPGASLPPFAIVTVNGSTTPVPLRVPPEFTATLDVAVLEPSPSSVPALTIVAPL